MVSSTNAGHRDIPRSGPRRGGSTATLLFVLLGPPVAWSLHFAVVYFLVAALCAAGSRAITLPIAFATVAAAGLSIGAGVVARRQRDAAAQGGVRPLFLLLGLVGAAFFTLVIVLEALPPLFLPPCPPGGS